MFINHGVSNTVTEQNFSKVFSELLNGETMQRTHLEGKRRNYNYSSLSASYPNICAVRKVNFAGPGSLVKLPTLCVEFGCNDDERRYELYSTKTVSRKRQLTIRKLFEDMQAFLFGVPFKVGSCFEEYCNQAYRGFEVTKISKGRGFRVNYELPNGELTATRYGFRPGPNSIVKQAITEPVVLYYPVTKSMARGSWF